MTSIDGIEIYPIISLSIFFIFFILLFIYVFRGGKHRFDEVSFYPMSKELEGEDIVSETTNPERKKTSDR